MPETAENAQVLPENSDLTARRIAQLAPHRFQKGKSGNPGGRPKRLTKILLRELRKRTAPNGSRKEELLVAAAVDRAIKNSDKMLEMVWDRTEGKAESNEQTGPVLVIINSAVIGDE